MTMPRCSCSVKSLTRTCTAVLKAVHVAREDVVHVELRGGEQQGVVQRVLNRVGRGREIENIRNRVVNVVIQRRARVDDVAVGGDGVAVNRRIERRAAGQFLAAQFLFRRREIPAGGGLDGLLLP